MAGYASEGLQIIIYCRERAEEKAVDIGEGAGATWGDTALSAKLIERAKRTVDAVRILKAVRLVGEDGGEVFRVAGGGARMACTEGVMRVGGYGTALTAGGGAVLAALRRWL
jgi:hypothetical protein